jgi:T5SS/PEP-CTERM-associated repeat protein
MVFSDTGSIGSSSSANGRLTIEGVDSKWLITNDLAVGDSGNGILEIIGGVTEVGGDTYLGRSIGGAGEIRFRNGTLTTRSLLAGFTDLRGTGTINTQGIVSDYDLVFDSNDGLQQQVIFASEPDQNITINLDTSTAGAMGAGHRGEGALTIAEGLVVASREGFLGYHATANGTANVYGAGSSWTLTGNLSVGYNGAGTLNVSNGGQVHVAGTTYVARFSGSAGSIRFNNGILTTQMLYASANQLAGTGVINTHGLVGDMDLVFDQAHPPQQQLLLNNEPDQHVTVNLDIDGSGEIGVGYAGAGSLTIADGVTVESQYPARIPSGRLAAP